MLTTQFKTDRRRAHPRQRGSTLLLVVAILLMVLITGMAYLQVAREDRKTTAGLGVKASLDSVTKATIDAFALELLIDRIDPATGQMFPDEAYDYPWQKDRYLANTAPSTATGSMEWMQISKLEAWNSTLGSVKYADGSTLQSGMAPQKADTVGNDIAQTGGVMADADGDFITDSKWQQAPVFQLGGMDWYIAARIIDNSSLLNVNVATAFTDGNTDTGYGNFPNYTARGYNPAHLDLTRLFRRGPAPAWRTELTQNTAQQQGLFAFRGVSTGTLPTPVGLTTLEFGGGANQPPTANGSVSDAWWNSIRYYGSASGQLGIENELELRHHGGLNNASSVAPVEDQFQLTLQRDDTQSTYEYAGSASPSTSIMQYLLGANSTADTVDMRLFKSLRPFITTRSGADDFVPEYLVGVSGDDGIGGNAAYRFDLNFHQGGITDGNDLRAIAIGARIEKVLNIGAPKYFETRGVNDDGRQVLGFQMGANIQDYSDRDSEPTTLRVTTSGSSTEYDISGMERLPFLREVYIQARYRDLDLDNDDGDMDPTTGQFDTWEFIPGSQAMAIELGNPFNQDMDLSNTPVRVVINGDTMTAVTLNNALIGGTLDARDDASEDDVMLLVSDPSDVPDMTDPTDQPEDGKYGIALNDDLALAPMGVPICGRLVSMPVPGVFTFPAGTDVEVELQVQTPDPDPMGSGGPIWVTYDKMELTGFQLPLSEAHTPAPTPVPAHGQRSMGRDGQTIRYVGMVNGALAAEIGYRPPDGLGYRTRLEGNQLEYLAEDTKAALLGSAELDVLQMTVPNRPFYSTTELGWMWTFAFMRDVAANLTITVPEMVNAKITQAGGAGVQPRQTFCLDFEYTAPVTTKVPHAAMVLERFTTLSGIENGIDDDGDTLVDETLEADTPELFIPGQLNINTVPLHTATLAAPLPEPLVEVEALMRGIIGYRDWNSTSPIDDPATPAINESLARNAALRQDQGIAGMGELLWVNPGGGNSAYDILRYGRNNTPDANPASAPPHDHINIFPMPEEPANEIVGLEYVEEEQLARLQFLQQTFTTRSDIYTGYILVRGYQTGTTTNPLVQRRVVVIFDRSSIYDKDQPVKILGIYQE